MHKNTKTKVYNYIYGNQKHQKTHLHTQAFLECRALRIKTEHLCCSSSYMSLGSLIKKNLALYHSYFIDYRQNELLERASFCLCIYMNVCECGCPYFMFKVACDCSYFCCLLDFSGFSFFVDCHKCHMTSEVADESQCVCWRLVDKSKAIKMLLLVKAHRKKDKSNNQKNC